MPDNPTTRRTVFVSHGRDDLEGQLFLSQVFHSPDSNFSPVFYSVRGPVPPHAATILEHLQTASALFVLLSSQLESRQYTRSWVGFEVGIAAQRGIPVVVVEPTAAAPIEFPVPGATNYIQRADRLVGIERTPWAAVARTACVHVPEEPWDASGEGAGTRFLAFLYNLDVDSWSVERKFKSHICRNVDCKAHFFVEESLLNGPFPCPVCRHETIGPMAGMMRDVEQAQARAIQSRKSVEE